MIINLLLLIAIPIFFDQIATFGGSVNFMRFSAAGAGFIFSIATYHLLTWRSCRLWQSS